MERNLTTEVLRAGYDDPETPVLGLLGLLWRVCDAEERLTSTLESAVVRQACDAAVGGLERREAISLVRTAAECYGEVASGGYSGVGLSLAERALGTVISGAEKEETESTQDLQPRVGRRELYVAALFEEATSYLVWSGLASFVGLVERLPTVAAAHELERELRQACWENVARKGPLPHLADSTGFAFAIREVSGELKRLHQGGVS